MEQTEIKRAPLTFGQLSLDRITRNLDEADAIHDWYNRSYRETYEQYHEFLASFYTYASFTEPESQFWLKRWISESDDERMRRREWFARLMRADSPDLPAAADFRDRASTMISIGRHQRQELSDEFSENELDLYKSLIRQLNDAGKQDVSSQIIIRLMEAGLLTGYDKNDNRVSIQDRLRFDGVGGEYEI